MENSNNKLDEATIGATDIFRTLRATDLLRVTSDYYACVSALQKPAPIWDWEGFERHVRAERGFRLLRVGYSTEPGSLEDLQSEALLVREKFLLDGRMPPLHLFADLRRRTLVAQVALPLQGGQGAIILAGDRDWLLPRTLLTRAQVDWARQGAATALTAMQTDSVQDEDAKKTLITALAPLDTPWYSGDKS